MSMGTERNLYWKPACTSCAMPAGSAVSCNQTVTVLEFLRHGLGLALCQTEKGFDTANQNSLIQGVFSSIPCTTKISTNGPWKQVTNTMLRVQDEFFFSVPLIEVTTQRMCPQTQVWFQASGPRTAKRRYSKVRAKNINFQKIIWMNQKIQKSINIKENLCLSCDGFLHEFIIQYNSIYFNNSPSKGWKGGGKGVTRITWFLVLDLLFLRRKNLPHPPSSAGKVGISIHFQRVAKGFFKFSKFTVTSWRKSKIYTNY